MKEFIFKQLENEKYLTMGDIIDRIDSELESIGHTDGNKIQPYLNTNYRWIPKDNKDNPLPGFSPVKVIEIGSWRPIIYTDDVAIDELKLWIED